MLHSCFVTRRFKRERDEATKKSKKVQYLAYARSEADIESDLDAIFEGLGYKANEYPFEDGWRTDGCNSKMVLELCKRNQIICHVYQAQVHNRNLLESWRPEEADNHTPQVNFFVRDDHCFWYGTPLEKRGNKEHQCYANNAIAQMRSVPIGDNDKLDYFRDKDILPCFRRTESVPPLSEWLPSTSLVDSAPNFVPFRRSKKAKRKSKRDKMQLQ